jgi:hypothetical protein
MSKPEVLRIRTPEGLLIPKLYLYSFLNLVEAQKYEIGQYIELRGEDVLGAILDGINTVKEILEKRKMEGSREKSLGGLVKIPMSGKNDKGIFTKLCSELKCDLDPIAILEAYIDVLKSPKVGGLERLMKGLESFNIGREGYALPSIFKLELYALTRRAFFEDGFSMDLRVSSDFFVLMLAGYLVSRVGSARLDKNNKGSWVSVHVLPLELAWSKSQWYILQGRLFERWPGVRPADALILYLLINLWDLLGNEPHDLMILGVVDPVGIKPAEAAVSIHAPLREVYIRAENLLKHILKEKWGKDVLTWLSRKALDVNEDVREVAEKFVKLIFLSIQGDIGALEELSLMSSRLEAGILSIRQPKGLERELLAIARDARRIAGRLLEYRFKPSHEPQKRDI